MLLLAHLAHSAFNLTPNKCSVIYFDNVCVDILITGNECVREIKHVP